MIRSSNRQRFWLLRITWGFVCYRVSSLAALQYLETTICTGIQRSSTGINDVKLNSGKHFQRSLLFADRNIRTFLKTKGLHTLFGVMRVVLWWCDHVCTYPMVAIMRWTAELCNLFSQRYRHLVTRSATTYLHIVTHKAGKLFTNYKGMIIRSHPTKSCASNIVE